MKYIGHHVSISGGLENAPINAAAEDANAFGMFLKNQRRWVSPKVRQEEVELFRAKCEEHKFDTNYILPHASYLLNTAAAGDEKFQKSCDALIDELERTAALSLRGVNFHPGSHLKEHSIEDACLRTAEAINIAHRAVKKAMVIVENSAGQGTNIGCSFQQLKLIVENVEDQSRIGVCLDTAHLYSAGYDLKDKYDQVWDEFDRIVGLKYLTAIHLNDSMKSLGSRVDRHAPIGEGTLGLEFFKIFMKDPRFDNMPIVIETPEEEKWREENILLRSFM